MKIVALVVITLWCAIMVIAAATFAPRCTPGEPSGPRIGGVIRIEGCP